VETTCYVSIEYFSNDIPFADYIVHNVVHISHNTERIMIGLPEIQHQEWLLPIEFSKRETFAYAIKVYSRIRELAKKPAERRKLFAELASHPLPPTDFVETEEYLDILKEAISQRMVGWQSSNDAYNKLPVHNDSLKCHDDLSRGVGGDDADFPSELLVAKTGSNTSSSSPVG
jgi:hypothetical protein